MGHGAVVKNPATTPQSHQDRAKAGADAGSGSDTCRDG